MAYNIAIRLRSMTDKKLVMLAAVVGVLALGLINTIATLMPPTTSDRIQTALADHIRSNGMPHCKPSPTELWRSIDQSHSDQAGYRYYEIFCDQRAKGGGHQFYTVRIDPQGQTRVHCTVGRCQ